MSTLQLKTPIEFFGKTYDSLTFTEPTGRVIAECGMPYKPDPDSDEEKPRPIVNTLAVHKLAARMADVPEEVIDLLKPMDWVAMVPRVLDFFGGTDAKASSTDTSTPPASGVT